MLPTDAHVSRQNLNSRAGCLNPRLGWLERNLAKSSASSGYQNLGTSTTAARTDCADYHDASPVLRTRMFTLVLAS